MGIKSFQGSRKNVEKESQELFKVSDFMTKDVISFRPEQSVESVIDTLISKKISGGPVVNENNELIGMISEGDCIKQLSESRYHNLPMENDNVENHMVKNVETIDANLNVFDAAKQFLNSKRRRFPIVEHNKLVGQISQKDILKAAMKLQANNWKAK